MINSITRSTDGLLAKVPFSKSKLKLPLASGGKIAPCKLANSKTIFWIFSFLLRNFMVLFCEERGGWEGGEDSEMTSGIFTLESGTLFCSSISFFSSADFFAPRRCFNPDKPWSKLITFDFIIILQRKTKHLKWFLVKATSISNYKK